MQPVFRHDLVWQHPLALVSTVDGRHMFSEPMAYTSLFGKMPDLDYNQDEKDLKGTIQVFS